MSAEDIGRCLTSGRSRYMRKIVILSAATCVCASFLLVQAIARADDRSNRQEAVLEQVVVTAQRREERLQDVPISISVISAKQLDSSTAMQGLNEVLRSVPGVVLDTSGYGGASSISIRGVTAGAPFLTGSSTVGYYIDSVPFGFVKNAFVPNAEVYDLDRVEVLRGPQGTLYGASSQNGVVRILTKDADLKSFEIKTRVNMSNTKYGSDNYRGDAAVNVPVIEGVLGVRAVAGYQRVGGWIDTPIENDANDGTVRNLRLKINAAPTDRLSLGLSAWFSRAKYGSSNFSPDGKTYPATLEESRKQDFDTYDLNVGYEFPWMSLTSNTSYIDYNDEVFNDLGPQQGLANTLYHLRFPAKTFTQEINLASTSEGVWRWTAGGMYRDSEDTTFGFRRQFTFPIDQLYKSRSYAVFGELTRLFMSGEWELTAGLRYFKDEVKETEVSNPFSAKTAGDYADNTFDAVTPRVALTWHPRTETMVYASYAEGFRSGSAQNPVITITFPPVKPDTLKNYEVGSKGTLLDGRLSYDVSAYYMDWRDVQQSLVVPFGGASLFTIVNGESASGVGYDLALTGHVTDKLTLSGAGSHNDLTFDDDVISGGTLLFRKGSRMGNSPEWTASFAADYAFGLGTGGLTGHLSGSATYKMGLSSTSIVSGTSVTNTAPSLTVGRASFAVESENEWAATLFVDNINNEQAPVSIIGLPNVLTRIPPRTIGVQLEYRFGQ